ncbi:hypothetical protein Pcinc_001832 [Petrolisthes cinctipes]|uniref:Uncharacterized protein n=1 Tax=Petrolisthes cinctipes TaxID=88211 RepID=A0AAE1GM54_PETCI|nr:hypothetical protein Pcinc_001832 [Petrolisthes cinctipes]
MPSHPIPSHPIPSHPIPSHPIPSHSIPSHPIPSHPIPSHPIPSHPIPSHPIPSHSIPSHSIPSHPIPSHPIPFIPSFDRRVCETAPTQPSVSHDLAQGRLKLAAVAEGGCYATDRRCCALLLDGTTAHHGWRTFNWVKERWMGEAEMKTPPH